MNIIAFMKQGVLPLLVAVMSWSATELTGIRSNLQDLKVQVAVLQEKISQLEKKP